MKKLKQNPVQSRFNFTQKEKIMKNLHFLFVFVLFLAGCASPVPTPITSLPETAATKPAPTIAPSATETPDPLPTAIPVTATPDAQQQEQVAILPLVAPCNFADQNISYSPSKAWVVAACRGDQPGSGLATKFVRMDGSRQWELSFSELYIKPYRSDDANLDTLREKTFLPARWTKNEDFVYLAVQTSSAEIPFKGYDGLFRLDLSTGKLRPVLKPAIAPLSATYAFKFSPAGNKLAYINQAVQPVTIVIIDTGTGEESKIALDVRFTQGGGLLWSQDEKQLLVSVLDEGRNGGNAVILYDFMTMSNEYILQQSADVYLPSEWSGVNTIYAEKYPGQWVYIDLASKEIKPAPAPKP